MQKKSKNIGGVLELRDNTRHPTILRLSIVRIVIVGRQ